MSDKEIETLRREKPQEFDALVAERVFGAKRIATAEEIGMAVIQKAPFIFTADDGEVFTAFGSSKWRPSIDPAADYAVLKHVRETWDIVRLRSLRYQQFLVVQQRDGVSGKDWWDVILNYQPGDYSAAALLALDKS